nr:hypothetical protein [Tanacetum cinerariifolium]
MVESFLYTQVEHLKDPVVQRTPLIDTVILIIPEKSTPTPTTEAQDTNVSESNSLSKVVQRLSKLENKVEALSKIDHAEAIKESVQASDSKPSKDKDTASSSKKGKASSQPSKTAKTVSADEIIHEDAIKAEEPVEDDVKVVIVRPETPYPDWHKESNADDATIQNSFNELMNTEKDPVTFDNLMCSTIEFTKFPKNHLKKDIITKADLEGPAFMLLKGTCRNSIELEYNLEQCPPRHLTILVDYFFNNDLEYLKTGYKERKYPISLTKTKAARYELEDKQFGYGYLKGIVVRRGDQNEHAFKEADFSRLHLNGIEDMFLLYVQRKLHNLTCDEIVDIINALRTFTRSIIIKKRVKDVQLKVESYQTKLNITHTKISCVDFSNKEPYTPMFEPRGVIYQNKRNKKILMRDDELYKFSDGTLMSVRHTLNVILHNFVLGYNKDAFSTWMEFRGNTRDFGSFGEETDKSYRKTIELPEGNNTVPLRSDTIRPTLDGSSSCSDVTYSSDKITSSCESCSGLHDTQYCMKTPKQAFVDYASSQTDGTRSRQYAMNQGLKNFNEATNTWKGNPNFNWAHAQIFTNSRNGSFSTYSSNYQTKLEKALIDFDSHQEKRLSSLRTQLGQQQDDMISKINLLWKTVSKKLDDTPIRNTARNPTAQINFTYTNDPAREEL